MSRSRLGREEREGWVSKFSTWEAAPKLLSDSFSGFHVGWNKYINGELLLYFAPAGHIFWGPGKPESAVSEGDGV